MIPSLNEFEVHKLASKYDFSGGQIENVARRHAIDSILHDQTGDILSTLFLHCDNERLDDYKSRKIGFWPLFLLKTVIFSIQIWNISIFYSP